MSYLGPQNDIGMVVTLTAMPNFDVDRSTMHGPLRDV